MNDTLTSSAPVHLAQFYASRRFLCEAVADFLAEAVATGSPAVVIARLATFEGVIDRMAAERGIGRAEMGQRVLFIDVHQVLQTFMDGDMLHPERFREGLVALIASIWTSGQGRGCWIYGEMVDVLCADRNYAAALQIERTWNGMSHAWPEVRVLCGYADDVFRHETTRDTFEALCREHGHVYEEPPLSLSGSTIYVVDDDPGARNAVARLLALAGARVELFGSAEEFVAEVTPTAEGCLVVDVQLPGLSGLELQRTLAAQAWGLPVIVMTGLSDARVEAEARRLGAAAFVRKPFDGNALIVALIDALSA